MTTAGETVPPALAFFRPATGRRGEPLIGSNVEVRFAFHVMGFPSYRVLIQDLNLVHDVVCDA